MTAKGEYLKKGAACTPCRYVFIITGRSKIFHRATFYTPNPRRKKKVNWIHQARKENEVSIQI